MTCLNVENEGRSSAESRCREVESLVACEFGGERFRYGGRFRNSIGRRTIAAGSGENGDRRVLHVQTPYVPNFFGAPNECGERRRIGQREISVAVIQEHRYRLIEPRGGH